MKKEKGFQKIFLPQVRQGCKGYSYNAESLFFFFFKERVMNKIDLIITEKKQTLRMRITKAISGDK